VRRRAGNRRRLSTTQIKQSRLIANLRVDYADMGRSAAEILQQKQEEEKQQKQSNKLQEEDKNNNKSPLGGPNNRRRLISSSSSDEEQPPQPSPRSPTTRLDRVTACDRRRLGDRVIPCDREEAINTLRRLSEEIDLSKNRSRTSSYRSPSCDGVIEEKPADDIITMTSHDNDVMTSPNDEKEISAVKGLESNTVVETRHDNDDGDSINETGSTKAASHVIKDDTFIISLQPTRDSVASTADADDSFVSAVESLSSPSPPTSSVETGTESEKLQPGTFTRQLSNPSKASVYYSAFDIDDLTYTKPISLGDDSIFEPAVTSSVTSSKTLTSSTTTSSPPKPAPRRSISDKVPVSPKVTKTPSVEKEPSAEEKTPSAETTKEPSSVKKTSSIKRTPSKKMIDQSTIVKLRRMSSAKRKERLRLAVKKYSYISVSDSESDYNGGLSDNNSGSDSDEISSNLVFSGEDSSSDDSDCLFTTKSNNKKKEQKTSKSTTTPKKRLVISAATQETTPVSSPRHETTPKKTTTPIIVKDEENKTVTAKVVENNHHPRVAKLSQSPIFNRRSPSPALEKLLSDSDSFPDLSDSQLPSSPELLESLMEELDETPNQSVGNLLSMWETKAPKPRRKVMTKKTKKLKSSSDQQQAEECMDDDISR